MRNPNCRLQIADCRLKNLKSQISNRNSSNLLIFQFFFYCLLFLCIFSSLFFVTITSYSLENSHYVNIHNLLAVPYLKYATVGILARDLENGEFLFEKNSTQYFIPASNMKLITAVAAINELGANYKFPTEIFIVQPYSNGNPHGIDLFIEGFGDPTLSKEFYDSNSKAMENFISEIVPQLHIFPKVNRNIILSDSFFNGTIYPKGWDSSNTVYCYAATTGALSVGQNCINITVIGANAAGRLPTVIFDPPIDSKDYKLEIKTVNRGKSYISFIETENKFILRGQIRRYKKIFLEESVKNTSLLFGSVLRNALRKRGILFNGEIVKSNSKYIENGKSFTIFSPNLISILNVMLRDSNNFIAEQIFRSLGGMSLEGIGSYSNGAKAVNKILDTLQFTEIHSQTIVDGSGLSKFNLVSSKMFVDILFYIYNSGNLNAFLQILPTPGEKGTLKKRLLGTPAQGNLWAKTGALKGACSLSGYFKRKNGNIVAFSMIFNNYKVHSNSIRNLQDKIILELLEM